MKKLLAILLVCGLMTSTIAPSVYAQQAKVVCKADTYDGKNFKIWSFGSQAKGITQEEISAGAWVAKSFAQMMDVCAREGWAINYVTGGGFYAYKK